LTSDGHVTRDAGHEDNAANLRAVLDHQFGPELRCVVDAHDIDPNQFLMFFKRGVKERNIFVDSSTGDADVELAAEFCLKCRKAFLERFHGRHIHPGLC